MPDEILTVFEDDGSVEIEHEETCIRSPRSKTFKMADGSYRKVHYSRPIHAFNMETGRYEEISNTFIQSTADKNDTNDFEGFECKNADMTVKLARCAGVGNTFKISKDQHKLYFSLVGQINESSGSARLYNSNAIIETPIIQTAFKTSDKVKNLNAYVAGQDFSRFMPLQAPEHKVIYEGALPDADIECSVGNDIFNTSIKINNITDPCRFVYRIKAVGLNAETASDGVINFYINTLTENEAENTTLKKEIIFIIDQPVVTDSEGKIQTASMRLERNGTEWLLILEAPSNFNYSAPVFLNMNVRTPDANTESTSIKSIRRIEPESAKPYIVKYKRQSDKQILITAIKELGCSVIVQADMFRCVTTNLKNSQLSSLRKLECIERIERDYDHSLQTLNGEFRNAEYYSDTVNNESAAVSVQKEDNDKNSVSDKLADEQNLDSKGQVSRNPYGVIHSQGIKGLGIKIAILDTGIAAHPDLNIAGGISFVGDETNYIDTDGHGTKMAGIIAASGINEPSMAGCAPDAEIYAVKVADEYGHAKTSAILKALEWCIKNYINIVNMSFGTYNYSEILKEALEYAGSNGIVLVAAAGNEGQFENEHRIMYPAAYPGVLAVGAGTGAEPLDFSNVNTRLDFIAPGYRYTTSLNGHYAESAGTSVSAAYMSGIIALAWSKNRQLQKNRLLNLIKNTAYVQDGHSGYVGYGAPSIASVLNAEESLYDTYTEKADKNSAVLENTPVFEQPILTGNASAMAVSNGSGNNGSGSGDPGTYPGSSMATAIPLQVGSITPGSIDKAGKHVWYKFVTNETSAHPNGGPGRYIICHLKTASYPLSAICDLYDSNGNWLATNGDLLNSNYSFYIERSFDKGKTYYVKIRAAIGASGAFAIALTYQADDYSDSMAYAYNLGDVYNNKSISGSLSTEQHEDVDCFCFTSSRNALFEIYTEGNVRAIGRLFYENGLFLTNNYGGGEGDNFKITYYIEAGKTYYLAVEQAYWEYTVTDYILKFKFICDWENAINEQYQYKMWLNNDQTSYPPNLIGFGYDWEDYYVFRSIEFISERAKHDYEIRILEDRYSQKSALEAAIDSGLKEDIAQALFGFGLGLLPGFGALSLTYEISNLVVHTIAEIIRSSYEQATIDINATNNYITNTNAIRWSSGIDTYLVYATITRTNIELNQPAEIYLGRDFSRGRFIALCMIDDPRKDDSRCKNCGICDNYIEY